MPRGLVCLPVLLALTACGALGSGLGYRVHVDSNPRGAVVVRGGVEVGTTPCDVSVTAADRRFELRLPGHATRAFEVPLVPNGWVLGNVLNLGLGMFVDSALGTDSKPSTAPVVVWLPPGTGSADVVWVAPGLDLPLVRAQGDPVYAVLAVVLFVGLSTAGR